ARYNSTCSDLESCSSAHRLCKGRRRQIDAFKATFTMLDNGRVFGEIAEDVGLDPVLILFPPTRCVFSRRTTVRPLLDRALPDRVCQHFGSVFVRSGKIDFVAEIEQEN